MKAFGFILFFIAIPAILFSDATIQSIGIEKDRDAYVIVFKGQGKSSLLYTSSVLENPPRISLDFAGIQSALSNRIIEVRDNPLISKISTAEKIEPGKTSLHVEVELKKSVEFSLSPFSGGFLLKLKAKPEPKLAEPKPTQPKPTQPKPQPTTNGVSKSPADPPIVASTTPPVSSQPEVPKPLEQIPTQTAPAELRLDIGPEDLLEINVFELPQFNTTTRVSGDGTVAIPLIGSIKVVGLTKQEAELKIAGALEEKYINKANVVVSIKEYKSKQIGVFGAIRNPGAMYILSHRTLLQVITDAGGILPDAAPKCFIIRANGKRLEIDLADLMNTGNPKWNVPIYPGDFINIPTGGKTVIYVLGEVRNPGAVDITFGSQMTVLTAIAKAGGLGANAGKSIEIRRKKADGQIELVKVNLKDILKGKKPDVDLHPGDVVNVPESFF